MGPHPLGGDESARMGGGFQAVVDRRCAITMKQRCGPANLSVDGLDPRLVGFHRTSAYTLGRLMREGTNDVEKRKSHRIRVNFPARYRSRSVSLDGEVCNLSTEGLFLRAEFLDAAGTIANVDLDLPGSDAPVQISGEVVRTDDKPLSCGMGIRFHNLRLPTRLQLANYMLLRTSRVAQ
jgi:hypothetical protein